MDPRERLFDMKYINIEYVNVYKYTHFEIDVKYLWGRYFEQKIKGNIKIFFNGENYSGKNSTINM